MDATRTHASIVRPTVKDIARAVVKLNERQDEDSIDLVAENLGFVIGRTVKLRKVTRRDVAIMLAVAGGDPFIVDKYAPAIAGRLRADMRNSSMSAWI